MDAIIQTSAFIPRHFYRCCDCLGVGATQTKFENVRDERGRTLDAINATCDACGGKLEYLGVTTKRSLRNLTGYECACDGKCTGAVGPSCDCKCGGENHGSNRVVAIYTDSAIPRLGIPKDAAVKAEAFRSLVEQFRAVWQVRFGSVTERKRYEYLGGDEFGRYMDGQHLWGRYVKAKHGRTHAARNRNLQLLISEVR